MTRGDKSFASAKRTWPGFMRGRSLTGRMYFGNDSAALSRDAATPNDLQSASPINTTARAGDDNAKAVSSKLPKAASPSAEGNLLCALLLAVSTWVCVASASPADARWLDAVALVESSDDSSAIGDGGRARGVFQFHRDAWEVARGINPEVVEYTRGSTNAAQSRLAAAAYLAWLRQRFAANGVTMPTDAQLYAAYNCGFAGFKLKYKFGVARTPRSTRAACVKLEKKIAALSRDAATK